MGIPFFRRAKRVQIADRVIPTSKQSADRVTPKTSSKEQINSTHTRTKSSYLSHFLLLH